MLVVPHIQESRQSTETSHKESMSMEQKEAARTEIKRGVEQCPSPVRQKAP